MFILPLAIEPTWLCSRLVWLGGDLCDYQAPLLSKDFSRRIGAAGFPALWTQVRGLLPSHHIVSLDRMPERVGAQASPFMALDGNRLHSCFAHKTVPEVRLAMMPQVDEALVGEQEARQAEAPQDRGIRTGVARDAGDGRGAIGAHSTC